ncbi:MAG: glycosyltransferase [Sphingomonas paucimobilis]
MPLPVLLDVTRLVELRWNARQPNGIDRVCLAYLRQFAHRAQAVVQHRGVVRIADAITSRRLFSLLVDDAGTCARVRARITGHIGWMLAAPQQPVRGSLYLNVSHTDYDLPTHARWIARHGLRAIYLVHDLIPLTHAEHCRPHAVRRHTGRVNGALRYGAGIIVGSRAVESDLKVYARRAQMPLPSLVCAPLAGAELRGSGPATAPGDYFLCVGTIESRKNHALLVRIWERLRTRFGASAPRLKIVGRWGSGVAALRGSLAASGGMNGLIEVVEQCDDAALAPLMLGARAVLMPTLAEGFGLPMAEALALGVPVIASDLPCFHEVGQGIPYLLNPNDIDAWEARIAAFDRAAAQRQRHVDALLAYRPTTWTSHFDCVESWLHSIAALPSHHAPPGARTWTPVSVVSDSRPVL